MGEKIYRFFRRDMEWLPLFDDEEASIDRGLGKGVWLAVCSFSSAES
jgi:hypothetical protein